MPTAPSHPTTNPTFKSPGADKPSVKGWCPGALTPMLCGDGLVVRIRPPAGRLSQTQAEGIASLADRYGNGMIDITSRANLQLRGVQTLDHADLINGLRLLGLIDPSPEVEARRNLVVTPFWTIGDSTQEIAATLSAALSQPDAPALPSKFGFAVDTGEHPVLRSTSADIRIERMPNGLVVRADGVQPAQAAAVNAGLDDGGRRADVEPGVPTADL